ncbi:flagellar brake protein YcgR [Sulfurimicrobium lacus]|uniref:Flagellar brake protein YcgR n=1 Tax=Sulfurimicrobium lacus TaxID=2715678 RepID=A0A6F8VHV9_9PROT|nr:flagellar brake protein [Sulfurimicrobium lacus]BCB28299.1 flagellar brake protein YcgR [Sulfurimicrobium lacus]
MEHPALETEAATDGSNYMIHSRLEILYILRAIQNKNELVTAYFNHGKDFILTSIIDVDGDAGSLTLDFGADEIINQRALASDKIILVTAMDRVKVQFVVDGMKPVEHLGRPAFKAGIPRELLKLQRREYYRLSTPVINPIKCVMTMAGGAKIEAAIADISLGGIAITDGQHVIAFEIGDKFSACRIVLPEIGTVTTEIEIRNVHEVTMKNGSKALRAGCMFIGLPSGQQAMIQRYIIKLDRERHAKLAQ